MVEEGNYMKSFKTLHTGAAKGRGSRQEKAAEHGPQLQVG